MCPAFILGFALFGLLFLLLFGEIKQGSDVGFFRVRRFVFFAHGFALMFCFRRVTAAAGAPTLKMLLGGGLSDCHRSVK